MPSLTQFDLHCRFPYSSTEDTLLLLDLMRQKKQQENEQKKVGAHIIIIIVYFFLLPYLIYMHRSQKKRKNTISAFSLICMQEPQKSKTRIIFRQEARIRQMALEQKQKKEAMRGVQVSTNQKLHLTNCHIYAHQYQLMEPNL